MLDKDITPYNDNGQKHGYWEEYYLNGQLSYKGYFVDGKPHGYWESYWSDGILFYKGNYINGKEIGFWFENNKEVYYAR